MATKLTPISQDVIINLTAKTAQVESSVKDLMQKLQATDLSDSFSKGLTNSLQKVLDKSQELKKTIGDTSSADSKIVDGWTKSYDKLATEITKVIAKIEGHTVQFGDLVQFDQSEFDKMKKALTDLKKAQKDLYSDLSLKANMPTPAKETTMSKTAINDLRKVFVQEYGDKELISKLIQEQIKLAETERSSAQDKLALLQEELLAQKAILEVQQDQQSIAKIDGRTVSGRAALKYAREQANLPSDASKAKVASEWKKQGLSVSEKDISALEKGIQTTSGSIDQLNSKLQEIQIYKNELLTFSDELAAKFDAMSQPIREAAIALREFQETQVEIASDKLASVAEDAEKTKEELQDVKIETEKVSDAFVQAENRQDFFSNIQTKIGQIFGLTTAFQALRRFVREAWSAIKDLDAAFTEIAVVTDFSTSDLWGSFETYNKMAQRLGVTTSDAIATSALFYQQGGLEIPKKRWNN